MGFERDRPTSVLMLSLHGYVAAQPELGKPDTGGQVTFVLALARQFHRLGYTVDVVTRGFEGQPVEDPIARGLRVWRIPFGGPGFLRKEDMHDHLAEFVANASGAIARSGRSYDVVCSHYWDAGWAGQRIADELGIPHVHTPHSLGSWKRRDMGGSTAEHEREYRFEERIAKEAFVYRASDHIIATTAQQLQELGKSYAVPERRVTVIPPGYEEDRYSAVGPESVRSIRRRLGFGAHDVYVVGRAASNKGYGLLIKALPVLRELVPRVRLQFAVGAGSAADRRLVGRWRALAAELRVDHLVHWKGYVPDELMADHYRAAAVFALPSRYEPFGMTAIEAMACGTPTVVTVHGGLHELVEYGTHALYADPKHADELAVALSLPLRYPRIRERLAREGARLARSDFGWRAIAARTLKVVERSRERHAERAIAADLAAEGRTASKAAV
jgi:mannosylfructose-phosphate synthase